MNASKKSWKIYQDEAKARQTSHWDLDYISREELDTLYNVGRGESETQQPNQAHGRRSTSPVK